MVRVPGADRECAVYLFGGDDGGEFVWQSDAPEGNRKAGAAESLGRPAIGRPDGHDELLYAAVLHAAERRCKFFRTHLLAAAVSQNQIRSGAPGRAVKVGKQASLRREFAIVTGDVSARSLKIALEQQGFGIRDRRAPRPDSGEKDFHRRSTELHRGATRIDTKWHKVMQIS